MQSREIVSQRDQIYVWDPFGRLFHWSLVAAFTVAYLTEEPLILFIFGRNAWTVSPLGRLWADSILRLQE
jgi:hypothetical protein